MFHPRNVGWFRLPRGTSGAERIYEMDLRHGGVEIQQFLST
jgi:hypothetical protein